MKLLKNFLAAIFGLLILLPMSIVGVLANLVISIRNKRLGKTPKKVRDVVKFGLLSGYDFFLGILYSIGIYSSVFLNVTSGLLVRELFTNKIDSDHLFGKVGITTSMALGRARLMGDLTTKGDDLLWVIEKILIDDNHFEESYSKYLDSGKVSGFKG
jgi:uncharacterized membrane protein